MFHGIVGSSNSGILRNLIHSKELIAKNDFSFFCANNSDYKNSNFNVSDNGILVCNSSKVSQKWESTSGEPDINLNSLKTLIVMGLGSIDGNLYLPKTVRFLQQFKLSENMLKAQFESIIEKSLTSRILCSLERAKATFPVYVFPEPLPSKQYPTLLSLGSQNIRNLEYIRLIYDECWKEYCVSLGVKYIPIPTQIVDKETGFMGDSAYMLDDGYHLNKKACKIVLEVFDSLPEIA